MLASLYLIAHVDRSNIGNARIEGLEQELGLSRTQWSLVLSVFFIPYMCLGAYRLSSYARGAIDFFAGFRKLIPFAEIPSNMTIKHYKRPSRYIGPLVICWGLVMVGHVFVQSFAGLLILRALLGVFE